MKPVGAAVAVAAALALARPGAAHPMPFSTLDVRLDETAIELSVTAHVFDLGHDLGVAPALLLDPAVAAERGPAIASLLRPRLEIAADGIPLTGAWTPPEVVAERQALRAHVRFPISAAPGTLTIATTLFPYDRDHQTFVNVYEAGQLATQVILDGTHRRLEHFTGTGSGRWAVSKRFVAAGVRHILSGLDHLLFLVALLLVGGSVRRLLLVVSAFTAGHSITLSLAALAIVGPPSRIIEPAIALSIVIVGTDNLLSRGGRDLRAWIALGFGLVHGFGFAGVLQEMGLPRRAVGWSLFSFNLGVELGQLLVVVMVAAALAALRSRSEQAGRRLAFAGSVAVAAVGTVWFIQRLFFPGGIS
jgi:hydrogenase/urease accessory protein HupE